MEVDSEPPPILTSSESQSGGGASNSTTCSPPPPSGITPAPLPDTAEENPSATDIERESTKPFGPQSDSSMASTPETVDGDYPSTFPATTIIMFYPCTAEQVRMTLMKRRSYDDTEYYELEYFDPPPNLLHPSLKKSPSRTCILPLPMSLLSIVRLLMSLLSSPEMQVSIRSGHPTMKRALRFLPLAQRRLRNLPSVVHLADLRILLRLTPWTCSIMTLMTTSALMALITMCRSLPFPIATTVWRMTHN
ncbi:hypothetical protein B0H10DRAFT_1308334 [Mycena sp. CBHHK59/15]|nr:hypothetical protein B0H10DRAFT_1308334 [Mycena sp. CBHHK59/15]